MAHKKGKTPHYRTDLPSQKKQPVEIDPVVKFVVDAWTKWDAHWADKFIKFESYYDKWIGMPPKRDEPWQAQHHKRLSWQAEKVLTSRYHTALFPKAAPIAPIATEVVDEMQGILACSMTSHWFKIGKFAAEFLRAERPAAVYGTGLFEDGWIQKVEEVPRKVEKEVGDFRPMTNAVTGEPVLDENGSVRSTQIGSKKVEQEEMRKEVVEDRYFVKKGNLASSFAEEITNLEHRHGRKACKLRRLVD